MLRVQYLAFLGQVMKFNLFEKVYLYYFNVPIG